MKGNFRNVAHALPQWLPRLAILATICVLASVVGPIMRESDQASILYGGVQLADGRDSFVGNSHYNFDKQFASYALVVLVRKLAPQVDLITATNATSFALFLERNRSPVVAWPLSLMAAGAGCDRPSLFARPVDTFSVFRERLRFGRSPAAGRGRLAPSRSTSLNWICTALLVAAAVGARADAVPVLPWILWCELPAESLSACCAELKCG